MVIGKLVHNSVNQLSQECAFDGPTGFADGRQHGPTTTMGSNMSLRLTGLVDPVLDLEV
jgi:hypothetical protein